MSKLTLTFANLLFAKEQFSARPGAKTYSASSRVPKLQLVDRVTESGIFISS